MPLPNLELKSRQNGGGSYINGGGVQNDPGQTSYREQVRDRLQNTPRGGGGGGANNNDFKTAKIDLSLFGAASENGGGSSYYRPLSRSNMASQQRRAGGGGGANINGNGASSNSYANSNRASMSNMKRQIVFYNKTYVPSSSDGNNNNDAADDNNDIVTTSNHNNQRRTSHRLSVNNDANENDLLSTSTRLNNSRDFYSKNNDDYFQSKSRHKNRGNNVDGGGKSNVLVLDRINQLSIDNTNNNRRPEPMPRQRNNNNNNNTNMTNEQPMGSRPNSRQQNHRSSHQQPLKPLSQQQQQRQQNEAFETTRSTIRRQRVQSNSNGDVSDIIGGNDANGDNEMFSYVIDHFKPPNNNNFENDVFGDDRFEVESVRDNETPVPKPRKFMQQSQQTPLVPSKISLRYELADSSGQNNTADAINLRMRRSTNNRPITPRTGPFTSSRQINFSYAGSSNIHQSNTSLDRENGDIINEMLMNRNPSSSSYLFNNNSSNNNNNTNTSNNNNNKMKIGGNNLESKRIELTQQYIKFQTQMSPIITKKASTSIEDSQTDFYDNSQSVLRFDNNN